MKKSRIPSRICAILLAFVFLFTVLPTPTRADAAPPVAPTITTDLSAAPVSVYQNVYGFYLNVEAKSNDGGALSFQWYSGADAGHVTNAISKNVYSYPTNSPPSSSCYPDVKTSGTTYYQVIVTDTLGGQTATAASAVAAVTVKDGLTLNVSVAESGGSPVPAGGYQYNVGDTATALEAAGSTTVPGGTWSYTWYDSSYHSTDGAVVTPSTAKDGKNDYSCSATYTLGGYDYHVGSSDNVSVTVTAASAQAPNLSAQPAGGTYLVNTPSLSVKPVSVSAGVSDGGTVTYQWYASTDNAAFTPIDGATKSSYTPPTSAAKATTYYRCVATNTLNSVSGHTYTSATTSDTAAVAFDDVAGVGGTWAGDGTADSPYLLTGQDDLLLLQKLVNTDGYAFQGYYFKLTGAVTLPAGWVPIGGLAAGQTGAANGKNILPFSGTFDGGNHTLTVSDGGLPLFGYVRFATVKNLNIYGTHIAGYGLVNNYTVDYGPTASYSDWTASAAYPEMPTTVRIDNVTLKDGSSTLKAGFIGGYASGADTVFIRDSTVESGVVIGYDKTQSSIGSFAGDFNGYVENCVSSADVYGVNKVGGLVGAKGQSMGNCTVQDSTFAGSVTATGNWAGGLVGSGYEAGSAPNTPCVSILNSYVIGSVTGADDVGGLLGGEPSCKQNWANGIGTIQNNYFWGTVTATTAGTQNIGGIVGFMKSLDRYNILSNNYYFDINGTFKGIGAVEAVDTTTPQYGRSDDPTGADAGTLAQSATPTQFADGTVTAALNRGVNSSGNWIEKDSLPGFGTAVHITGLSLTGYQVRMKGGSTLDPSAMTAYASYSDGTTQKVDMSQVSFSGFDSDLKGFNTVTATYANHTYLFEVQITTNADYTDDVDAAWDTVNGADYTFSMDEANTSDGIKALIEREIAALNLNGVTATVTMDAFTPAAAGTEGDTTGTPGSFTFTVNLSKGKGAANVSDSVSPLTGTIAASAWTPSGPDAANPDAGGPDSNVTTPDSPSSAPDGSTAADGPAPNPQTGTRAGGLPAEAAVLSAAALAALVCLKRRHGTKK